MKMKIAIVVAVSIVGLCQFASADILVNGSFETGITTASGAWYEFITADQTNKPEGWQTTVNGRGASWWRYNSTGPDQPGLATIGLVNVTPSDGNFMLTLWASVEANGPTTVLSQTFPTVVGQEYQLSFDQSAVLAPTVGFCTFRLGVDVAGTSQELVVSGAGSPGDTFADYISLPYVNRTITFTATAPTTTLSFQDRSIPSEYAGNPNTFASTIDRVSVVAVPEPGSIVLLTLGVISLIAFVRNDRRK